MLFALALNVNEDVIEVHYDKNVELLCQDLIDITLECGQYIGQSKGHHLILKIAIVCHESCLLFVAFPDPHSMVSIG